ncbi:MAG: D-alanine--D-alanine ligase family protein [Rubricoccaceae bacterium]|nr:D-alanine--D-alanine ligase family protein [Rubricoccaceae bacterium]
MTNTLHVGLIYGGLSSEHEVSIRSARNVHAALDPSTYRVTLLYIDRKGDWRVVPADHLASDGGRAEGGEGERLLFAPGQNGGAVLTRQGDTAPEPLGLDVAFPVLHGQNGEDGRVQGFLQTLGLPYVGPDVLGSAVCMDKEVAKRLLRDAGLPIVPFRVVRRGEPRPTYAGVSDALGSVLFVKPANSGSSVGTTKVEDASSFPDAVDTALRYDHKVLIETAVRGREIECAVLGNETPRASVPGEIVSTAQFYTYEAKYLDADASRMVVPADLPEAVADRVRDLAVEACRVLGCEGMARVDFFVSHDGDISINEVNTIPGFTERSMYPVMWQETGLPYPALLDALIRLALDRHARDAGLRTTRT